MNNQKMQCDVERLEYDFSRGHGKVYVAPGHCVDMAGCIEVFRTIHLFVTSIDTFAGDEPDTYYRLYDNGWEAYLPARPFREAALKSLISSPQISDYSKV